MNKLDTQELHVHDMLEELRTASDYRLAAQALDEAVREFKQLAKEHSSKETTNEHH